VKQPVGATLTTTTSSASGYAGDRDEMIPREQRHTQVVSSSEIVRRREEARRQAAAKLKEAKQEKARRLRALEPRVSPCLAPTCPHALCSASPVVHMVPIPPISTTIVVHQSSSTTPFGCFIRTAVVRIVCTVLSVKGCAMQADAMIRDWASKQTLRHLLGSFPQIWDDIPPEQQALFPPDLCVRVQCRAIQRRPPFVNQSATHVRLRIAQVRCDCAR
jgi:hypothetical protein